MSGPVVAIGYILLIPSILGMIFSLLLMFATAYRGSALGPTVRESAATDLRQAGVGEPIVQKVLASQQVVEADMATLTAEQKAAVEKAVSSIDAVQAASGAATIIGGGLAMFFAIAFFVGGLLGWLLVMKKKVLACTSCGAIVPAS